MRPSVLQEDAAERERAEHERRQKRKQKARDKERTAKERAAAERKASEGEAGTQQEAQVKQGEEEAAVERWSCACREQRQTRAWCLALARQQAETSSERKGDC